MQILRRGACVLTVVLTVGLSAAASGRMAMYALIDSVVFEPNDAAPVTMKVSGTFAYGDLTPSRDSTVEGQMSTPRSGYLYFALPADEAAKREALAEWRDLKATAGTGQAVAFGLWGYVSTFAEAKTEAAAAGSNVRTLPTNGRASVGAPANLVIRAANDATGAPTIYTPNAGVVKIPESGSRAYIVRQLKQAAPAGKTQQR